MPTTNLRRKIAKDYCRDILWIDDQIKPLADDAVERKEFIDFFHPICEEFASNEIICHLKGFLQTEGEHDPYGEGSNDLEICKKLAAKADVVILDWNLGNQDHRHSSAIIRDLITRGGNRFIIVLSQEPRLREQFETEFNTELNRHESNWYKNNKGIFAYLFKKSDFREPGSGANLIDQIFNQLAIAYPDYLHWAALEIAAKIKEFSPSWLGNLPQNTDLGILAETIHSAEDISEAIFENLLEDLEEAINPSSIASIEKNALNFSLWPKATEYQSQLLTEIADLGRADQDKVKALVPTTTEDIRPLDQNYRKSPKFCADFSHIPSIKKLADSINSLGEFCEIRSSSNRSTTKRGTIIKSTTVGADDSEVLICVSQSCDCVRSASLLFLAGQEVANLKGKPGETFLRIAEKNYIFKASADNLKIFPINTATRIPSNYEVLGRVRESIVTRIISRFWGQTTRIGINQPRFLRESREEIA